MRHFRLVADITGVTLIEAILASVLLALVAISMARFFPAATRTTVNSQRQWEATALTTTLLQQIEADPYGLVPLTPHTAKRPTGGNVFAATSNPGGCDCNQVSAANLPLASTPTVTLNGLTYTQQACINLIERNAGNTGWTSYCWDTGNFKETHLKNIRVRTSWTLGKRKEAVEMEGQVSER